ncbi:MAG: hypothetical protein FJZ86_18290 [Chloroflexi bacterium]|nr:hypothetical protein [Chloroflexota bacterium]
MTKQRILNDGKDSDFSSWLRMQDEISSEKGFISTDIDFLWRNYKTGEWMILEEKTHGAIVPRWQGQFLMLIDSLGEKDKLYKGTYLVRFENTDPDNGRIMVNKRLLSRNDFISFLRFELKIDPVPLHDVKKK